MERLSCRSKRNRSKLHKDGVVAVRENPLRPLITAAELRKRNMIYRRIRELREDHDLKQRELCKLLCCSQQTYSDYETGKVVANRAEETTAHSQNGYRFMVFPTKKPRHAISSPHASITI